MPEGNNTLLGGLCEDVFNQLINLFMESKRTEEVKKRLIDPLVDYYKNKLFVFYGIITLLLVLVIISNFYIIYQLHK